MKLSPLAAGIYLLPVSVALSICGPISGWASDRYENGSDSYLLLACLFLRLDIFMLTEMGQEGII